jgi:hypothetical protein
MQPFERINQARCLTTQAPSPSSSKLHLQLESQSGALKGISQLDIECSGIYISIKRNLQQIALQLTLSRYSQYKWHFEKEPTSK